MTNLFNSNISFVFGNDGDELLFMFFLSYLVLAKLDLKIQFNYITNYIVLFQVNLK